MPSTAYTGPRFPLEALEALFPPLELNNGDGVRVVSPLHQLATVSGIAERSLFRWRAEGGLPEHQADRIACRLGLHPGLVWPEWWAVA